MTRQPISVSTLSNYIKQIFDAESMLFDLDVIGEITSFNISGKNAFFVIKDEDSILNCVLFNAYLFKKPNIGDKVIVHGSPKYYAKGGKLNFNAISIEPYGEGDIYKRFLELKNRLEKEGLFAIEHKKAMPTKIQRIGVITSETGAVIHDIINVSTRRNAGQDIVLYPIKVQGIGADIEIAKAIDFFSEYNNIDAIIVGRGGGSEEDLQNFNSEIVARAVYNCKKFIVSAVGHETNFTLCDFASDLRAPTPSAAAELLTKDNSERKYNLELIMQNISSCISQKIESKIFQTERLYEKIETLIDSKFQSYQNKLAIISEFINNANPNLILKKGYAKIEKDGKIVNSIKDIKIDDKVSIYLYDGRINATINKVDSKNGFWKKYWRTK